MQEQRSSTAKNNKKEGKRQTGTGREERAARSSLEPAGGGTVWSSSRLAKAPTGTELSGSSTCLQAGLLLELFFGDLM